MRAFGFEIRRTGIPTLPPAASSIVLSLLLSTAAFGAPAFQSGDFDFGVFASRDATLYGERRLRVLGPFYEKRTGADGTGFVAFRPFYCRTVDPGARRSRTEILWPLLVAKEIENQDSRQFLTVYYTDFDKSHQGSRYRLWALPFVFAGRDAKGEGYFGVFPLVGRIHEILTWDKWEFFLFPLYAHSFKAGGQETYDVLWPFFSWTRGDDIWRIRVLPLFGWAEKKGEWKRSFFIWPLWTEATYKRPNESGHGFVFFPIGGYYKKADSESFLFLPPLFRRTVGMNRDELTAPWPFIQIGKGKVNRFYIWPLGGAKSEAGLTTAFILWPIISVWHRDLPDRVSSRFMVIPFLQHQRCRKKLPGDDRKLGEVLDRSFKIWPVFRYKETGETSKTVAPALWPAFESRSVENNYEPLWSVFSHVKRGDAVNDDLLWGLVRGRRDGKSFALSIFPLVSWKGSDEDGGERSFSLLMGLFGYERKGSSTRLRLLFIPFGKKKPASAAGKEETGR